MIDPVSDGEVDFFGNPLGRRDGQPAEPVACPFCGTGFTRPADLETHVQDAHGHRTRPRFTGRTARTSARFRSWAYGLRFLPLWFVLLLNVLLTAMLWLAWGQDAQLFSLTGDQSGVAKAWIIRCSMLPSVLLLAYRVGTRTDR